IQTVLHLYLLWGVVVGVGTGSTALVLSATVVNRWFTTQRGLAMGLLGAASSTGRLVFLPLLAMVVAALRWQSGGSVVARGVVIWLRYASSHSFWVARPRPWGAPPTARGAMWYPGALPLRLPLRPRWYPSGWRSATAISGGSGVPSRSAGRRPTA